MLDEYQQLLAIGVYQRAKALLGSGDLGSIIRCEMLETFRRSDAHCRSSPWRAAWKGEGGGCCLIRRRAGLYSAHSHTREAGPHRAADEPRSPMVADVFAICTWSWGGVAFKRKHPFARKSTGLVDAGKPVDFHRGHRGTGRSDCQKRPCRVSGKMGLHIAELRKPSMHGKVRRQAYNPLHLRSDAAASVESVAARCASPSLCLAKMQTAGSLARRDVTHQTYRLHETIVIDDSSTDSSLAEIDRSGAALKLLQVDTHNAAVARNAGIEAATGDWIALLGADDVWYPNHLARARVA